MYSVVYCIVQNVYTFSAVEGTLGAVSPGSTNGALLLSLKHRVILGSKVCVKL